MALLPVVPNKLNFLWFLIALFIVQVTNYNFVVWTFRRRERRELDGAVDGSAFVGHFILMSLFALFSTTVGSVDDWSLTKMLPAVVIAYLAQLALMAGEYYVVTQEDEDLADNVALGCRLVGPLSFLLLN